MTIANKRWFDLASVGVAGVFCGLLVCLRAHLPVFSDSWYHLAVVRAFFERGFSTHAWWEYAPFGRPHLYPPLFHLASAAALRATGWSLLDLARFYNVVTFPLLLLAGWLAARCLFGPRAALLTVLLLTLNIGLVFPCSLIIMPGTYAVLLWSFVYVLLLRGKWLLAGLVLAVTSYLHLGVAAAAMASLIVFAVLKPQFAARTLLTATIAVVMFCPWLWHLYHFRAFLRSGTARLPVFVPALTVGAGVLGVVVAVRHRENESMAVISMILASAIFWFTLQERFWTYGGFLFALLGGYGIDRCRGRWTRWAVPVLVASCLTVTPFLKPSTMQLALPIPYQNTRFLMPSPFLTFVEWQRTDEAAKIPRALPAELVELAQWIREHVDREDVLLTDDRLLGSQLFVLTGRRTTSGLWSEVMTQELKDKVRHYYETASGYIVVDQNRPNESGLAGNTVPMASFGNYAVFRHGG